MAETQEIEQPQVEEQQQQGPGDPVEQYYNYLKQAGANVAPSLQSFKNTLNNEKNALQYYNYLKQNNFDTAPTYDSFTRTLGLKKNINLPSEDYGRIPIQKQAIESTGIPRNIPKIGTIPTPDQLAEKHAVTQGLLQKEIAGNDDLIPDLVKKQKSHAASLRRMAETGLQPRSDQPLTNVQLQAQQLQEPTPQTEVTPEDIAGFKYNLQSNPTATRAFLQHVVDAKPDKAKQIQEAMYVNDAMDRMKESDAQDKSGKIYQNANKIAKGDLHYNVQGGTLIKPEGVWESIGTGLKEKNKAFNDYDYFTSHSDTENIQELEKRRKEFDPDEPIPLPEGLVGQFAGGLASQPLKGMLAGKAGGFITANIPGAEEFAPTVDKFITTAVSSRDFMKMSYANALQRNYHQLRSQGLEPQDAYGKAKSQADQEALIDAASGAVMMYTGSKIGEMKLPPFNLSEGFQNAVVNGLKQGAKGVGEATAVGLIQAAGEEYKSELGEQKGIQQPDISQRLGSAAKSGALFTLGMATIAKAGNLLSGKTRAQILQGLSKAPPEKVNAELGEQILNGHITPDEAKNAETVINEHRDLNAQIPDNITDESKLKIHDKIARRSELESQLETMDKAYHPEIKEKIKAINEDILELSKDKRSRGEEDILSPKTTTDEEAGKAEAQTEGLLKPEGAEADQPVAGAAPSTEPVSEKIQPDEAFRTLNYGDNRGKPESKEARDKINQEILNNDPIGKTGDRFSDFLAKVIPRFKNLMDTEQHNTVLVTHSSVRKALRVWEEMGRPDTIEGDQLKEFAQKYIDEPIKKEGSIDSFKGDNGNEIKVVRHGETEDNKLSEFRDNTTQLTDKGVNQAKIAGQNLSNEIKGEVPKIITSDLPRAVHTANIIHNELFGENVPRETFHEGDLVQSPHFEGERKVTHVSEDGRNIVVEDPGGQHIKHEISANDANFKDDLAANYSKVKKEIFDGLDKDLEKALRRMQDQGLIKIDCN